MDSSTLLTAAAVTVISSIGWTWYYVFSSKPNSQYDDALFPVQKKDYKKDIVYLYTFKPIKTLTLSPFATKLAIFLKYSKIPFEVVPGDHFGKTPKNKLPVIEFNGQVHSDTDRIVALLKQHFTDIDSDLSPTEQATSLAIIRMVEEHLYWVFVHFRWIEENASKQMRNLIMGNSFFLSNVIFPFIRAQVRKSLWGQGIGRHTEADMIQFARDDLKALETLLGKDDFFFGKSKPHLVDIVVYSMISMALDPEEFIQSRVVDVVKEYKTLLAFRDRMNALLK